MTNIVTRLRAAHPNSPQYAVGSNILAEAADEIERLESERKLCFAKYEEWRTRAERLQAELAALRSSHPAYPSSVEPTALPETLVRWMDAKTWRCRCNAPGNMNVWGSSMCPDCGTCRPERTSGE